MKVILPCFPGELNEITCRRDRMLKTEMKEKNLKNLLKVETTN